MASKKIIYTFLGFALLLQLSFASPVPDDDSKSTEASDAKVELAKNAILELNKVADDVVPKQVEVIREVLKDLKDDKESTDADEEVIKNIEEFLKKSDEADKDPDTKISLEWLFKINALVDPYDEVGKPSKKNPKVHDLLEKHGWRPIRDHFDELIEPVVDKLGKNAKEHYDSLTDEQKKDKEAKQLAKWIAKYDDEENDIGDKINLLIDFLFDDDDSDESK